MRSDKGESWHRLLNYNPTCGDQDEKYTNATLCLRARKTLTPRFTNLFTDFEKKNDCFAV